MSNFLFDWLKLSNCSSWGVGVFFVIVYRTSLLFFPLDLVWQVYLIGRVQQRSKEYMYTCGVLLLFAKYPITRVEFSIKSYTCV